MNIFETIFGLLGKVFYFIYLKYSQTNISKNALTNKLSKNVANLGPLK
jgi:hypothetical protein